MVDSSQSQGPSVQRLQGVPCPPGTTQEMINTFPRLNAREGDIYIVSYPKPGKVYIVNLHHVTDVRVLSIFKKLANQNSQ